jgi:hypothetical protein
MRRPDKYLIGDTMQVTWIDSGTTPSSLHFAVYNGSETLVDSASMTSSGNGHYYGFHTVPNSTGNYAVKTFATISGKPYGRIEIYKAVNGEVD